VKGNVIFFVLCCLTSIQDKKCQQTKNTGRSPEVGEEYLQKPTPSTRGGTTGLQPQHWGRGQGDGKFEASLSYTV
jgi:hypothetical protein